MEKDYVVAKSNHFIINSSYDLSLEEQRIILTLASLVQPSDEKFKEYSFKVGEFMDLIGVKDRSKYSLLPQITKNLMKKVFEIREENEIIQIAWLSVAKHNLGTGTITLGFSPYLKPYLLQLKSYFTKYKLSNVLKMKSKYSPRLYEILKMNEYNKKGFEVEVSELRRLFKAENIYKKYNDFKKKIILKAQEELKEHSDIKFEFEEIKLARTVVSIRFFVFENIKQEEPVKKKTKAVEKTASEKKADKIIKEKIADEQRIKDIHEEFKEVYSYYENSSDLEKADLEKEAEKIYLESIGAKRLGTITKKTFEKAKKTYIVTAIRNRMYD